MKTQATSRITCCAGLFLWLVMPAGIMAQATAVGPTVPPPSSSPSPLPSPSPGISAAEQSATEEGLRPLYGLQSVLVETLDGNIVATQSADQVFNPASSIKLATALVALRSLGPQHRFSTGFWTDGTFEKTTGTLKGNLFVSGRDPSFHYEHALMVARQLNMLGIRTITGDLVVAPGFTMNFNWSARGSAERLYDTLDSTLRPAAATSAWVYDRTAIGDVESLKKVPSVAVMGEVYVNTVAPNAKLLVTHRSSKLTDILKVLLCYSNNFMAERIGDNVGGRETVQRELVNTLGIPAAEVRLASLSGLGPNRVTPRAMMTILRALRAELRKHKLSPADIMPVAGIDPGTLEERFTGLAWRGSVIAKTGTLVRTDGGASSLVGQMKTSNGEVLLFVIMNQRGSVLRFRENQDYMVMQVQNSRGGPKAFDYKPQALTMKLADTTSTVAIESEEYEPNLKAKGTLP